MDSKRSKQQRHPFDRVSQFPHSVPHLHFLLLREKSDTHPVLIPVICKRLVFNEVVHLRLLLRPPVIQPLLHTSTDFLQRRFRINQLRDRNNLHVEMASDLLSLSISPLHNPHSPQSAHDRREVQILHPLITIAADLSTIAIELHRRVVNVVLLAADLRLVSKSLQQVCEAS